MSLGQIESSGKGIGKFGPDVYVGNPMADAESRIERDNLHLSLADRLKLEDEINSAPRLIPAGPVTFSTSQVLQKWPLIVWDVNGYYQELGVSWRATKKEICEAYKKLNGHESERLTYIFKQLLDTETRNGYDSTPLGSIFFDKYHAEKVKAQMLSDQVAEHGRMLSFDEQIDKDLEAIDLTQYLGKKWDEEAGEWLEKIENSGRFRWKMGYYLWRVNDYDTDRLHRWQVALLQAAAESKEVLELSVGLVGGCEEQPVRIKRIGYRCVIFLGHSQEPSLALAKQALRVVNQQQDK